MRFIPAVSLVRIQLQPPTARWSRGLRHRPFTAVTRVRIPSGSPKIPTASAVGIFTLYFLLFTLGENSTHGCSAVNLYVIVIMEYLFYNITAKAFVIFIGSYVYEFKNRRLAELYCQKMKPKRLWNIYCLPKNTRTVTIPPTIWASINSNQFS